MDKLLYGYPYGLASLRMVILLHNNNLTIKQFSNFNKFGVVKINYQKKEFYY